MAFRWTIVGGTGYDVEDVDDPRTMEMTCPSCEKYVRFVEKELIKNLRVFGVPLVGVEKGRRVFECPRCRTCVEPPETEHDAGDPAVAEWREQLRKLEDDARLWDRRARMADEHHEAELAQEARGFQLRAEREAEHARARLDRASEHTTVERPKAPAIVARAGGAVVDRGSDDAFAALKRRLAIRQPPVAEDTTSTPGAALPPSPEPPDADDLAALRDRLANRPATDAPQGADALDALRAELATPAATDPPVVHADVPPAPPSGPAADAPSPAPPEPTDDDPVSALKRKLRGPR